MKCSRKIEPVLMVLLCCCCCWLGLAAPSGSQESLNHTLPAEQVLCHESQLEHSLGRLSVQYPDSPLNQVARTILVSPGSQFLFEGLVATNQLWRFDAPSELFLPPPEYYLAFHINPTVRSLLVNPARLPIGQASLTREDSASNLLDHNVYIETTLRLAPKKGGDLSGALSINNSRVQAIGAPYNGFLSSSVLPGRGLEQDGLLDSCQADLTEFDRHVFAILQRSLRVSASSNGSLLDSEVSIFRGSDPHIFRVNVYPVPLPDIGPATGKLAVEIAIQWTPLGVLTTGEARVLAPCAAHSIGGCTDISVPTTLFIARPVFGGHEYWRQDDPGFAEVYLSEVGASPPATANFAALLAGTEWNSYSP